MGGGERGEAKVCGRGKSWQVKVKRRSVTQVKLFCPIELQVIRNRKCQSRSITNIMWPQLRRALCSAILGVQSSFCLEVSAGWAGPAA